MLWLPMAFIKHEFQIRQAKDTTALAAAAWHLYIIMIWYFKWYHFMRVSKIVVIMLWEDSVMTVGIGGMNMIIFFA